MISQAQLQPVKVSDTPYNRTQDIQAPALPDSDAAALASRTCRKSGRFWYNAPEKRKRTSS
jgi:hypothetical protein